MSSNTDIFFYFAIIGGAIISLMYDDIKASLGSVGLVFMWHIARRGKVKQ